LFSLKAPYLNLPAELLVDTTRSRHTEQVAFTFFLADERARRLTQTPLHCQQLQAKTNIELTAVMRTATGETRDRALDLAHARKISPTIGTAVDVTRRATVRRKRQRMTALLSWNSQIATSPLPLGSVR